MTTIKMIIVVVGALGYIVGIVMVCIGISTTGIIDIRILQIEGKLTTGSAGLLVMALSVLLMLGTVWKPEKVRVLEILKKRSGEDEKPEELEHRKEMNSERMM